MGLEPAAVCGEHFVDDGEAQATARGGGVAADERFAELGKVVLGDAGAGVRDGEGDGGVVGVDENADVASFAESVAQGVADQVAQGADDVAVGGADPYAFGRHLDGEVRV